MKSLIDLDAAYHATPPYARRIWLIVSLLLYLSGLLVGYVAGSLL
jgi:hypothetical protein